MLDVVVGGRARRPGTERHADLVSLVRWSYDLLGPDEARLFRHLAVFVGGFDLAVAERVADALGVPAPTAAVARLAEASLLTVDGDPPRFAMLNTIRAFGEEELDRHGETERRLRRCSWTGRSSSPASRWTATTRRSSCRWSPAC